MITVVEKRRAKFHRRSFDGLQLMPQKFLKVTEYVCELIAQSPDISIKTSSESVLHFFVWEN